MGSRRGPRRHLFPARRRIRAGRGPLTGFEANEAPPTVGGGRYRLGPTIGKGATARVYRAEDTLLGVPRAVKILVADGEARDVLSARLRAEARAMARVEHPNILRIFDAGTEGGHDWVVMELAEGGTLQQRLDATGPLPPGTAIRYAVQVLAALAAAHRAGVVHRDVKPHNILVGRDGVARLGDFGIALLRRDDDVRHTRVGVAMGSVAYMPPEQRIDARSVGPEADIYAVGATLYALLTAGNPVDLFAAGPDSPRWNDVHPCVRTIVQRATRQEPADRYASARAMGVDLLDALAHVTGSDTPAEHDATERAAQLLLEDTAVVEGIRAAASTPPRSEAPPDGPRAPRSDVPRPGGPRSDGPRSNPHGVPIPAGFALTEIADAAAQPVRREAAGVPRTVLWLAILAFILPAAGVIAFHRHNPLEAALRPAASRLARPGEADHAAKASPEPGATAPDGTASAAPAEATAPYDATVAAGPVSSPARADAQAAGAQAPGVQAPGAQAPAAPETRSPADLTATSAAPLGAPARAETASPSGTAAPASPPGTDPGASPVASAAPAPGGHWTGAFGGHVADLSLRGPATALAGSITVRFQGNAVQSPVTGTWDPASGVLTLVDLDDDPDAGRYEGRMGSDGATLDGTFDGRYTGKRVVFHFRRAP